MRGSPTLDKGVSIGIGVGAGVGRPQTPPNTICFSANFNEPNAEIARYEFNDPSTQIFFDDFSAGIVGWREEGNVALSIVSEELRTTTEVDSVNPGYAQQEILVGDSVYYSFTITNTGGFSSGRLRLGNVPNNSFYTGGSLIISSGVTEVVSFSTTTTTLSMGFGTSSATINNFNDWDNVIVERNPALDGWQRNNGECLLSTPNQKFRIKNGSEFLKTATREEIAIANGWYLITVTVDTDNPDFGRYTVGSDNITLTDLVNETNLSPGTYSSQFQSPNASFWPTLSTNTNGVGSYSTYDDLILEQIVALGVWTEHLSTISIDNQRLKIINLPSAAGYARHPIQVYAGVDYDVKAELAEIVGDPRSLVRIRDEALAVIASTAPSNDLGVKNTSFTATTTTTYYIECVNNNPETDAASLWDNILIEC